MVSRDAFNARKVRRRLCSAGTMGDTLAGLSRTDPAKALVMACFGHLAADGSVEWHMFDNGDIQLRFDTGEVFLLAETAIVRLA